MNLLETVAFVVLINGFLIEILILHILFKMLPFHSASTSHLAVLNKPLLLY